MTEFSRSNWGPEDLRRRTPAGSRTGWRPRPLRVLVLSVVLGAALGQGSGCAGTHVRVALRIEAPQDDRDAEVYVDGNYVGQVRAVQEASTGPIQLGPGLHRLEIRKPGRFPQQQTVEVTRQSPAEIVVHAELLQDPT